MPQEYLSTDPSAGVSVKDARYLSFDAGAGDPMPAPSSGIGVSPIAVAAADLARRGAVRLGEEVATSPLTARLVKAATSKATGAIVGGIAGHGATGAAIGYGAGEVASSPAVQGALTAATRGGGGLLARLAGSRVARALTGPVGFYATLLTARPQPDPGSPVMAMMTKRQRQIEADFIRQQMNLQQGRQADVDLPAVRNLTGTRR